MAWGQVSTPYNVTPKRITFGVGVATKIVAASNSLNKNKADYVCDGTADEVQINQALNALPSTGGYVHLLEGTYSINANIVIPNDNISLVGGGKGTLITTNTINLDMIFCENVDNITIRDLHIDGNSSSGSDAIKLNSGVTNSIVSGCLIENAGLNSITTNSTGTGITDTKIVNNICVNSRLHGIIIYNSSNNEIIGNTCRDGGTTGIGIALSVGSNNKIIGNDCRNNGSHGIGVTGDNTHNIISNNNCQSNGGNGIFMFRVGTAGYNVVIGNNCQANTQHGIQIATAHSNNIISSNMCINNDFGNTGSYDGIFLQSSDNNVILGNRCDGNDRYGINVSNAGCNDNLVVGNHLMTNTTAGLNDAGTATKKVANLVASCSLVGSLMPVIEEYPGSSCTGASGATGRTLTLANTLLSANEQVTLDGLTLRSGAANHYTIAHAAAASVITFNVAVDDDTPITVRYYT